jgi:hypothetical protein
MTMASREYQHLQNQITQMSNDIASLLMVLIEMKIIRVTKDEHGNLVYDTGKDVKSEVQ